MASIRWDKNSAEYNIPPEVKKFGLPMAERMRKEANRARFDIELAFAKKTSPKALVKQLNKVYVANREKAKAEGNPLYKLGLLPSPTLLKRQAGEGRYLANASDHDPYVMSAYGSVESTLPPRALPNYINEDDVQEQINAGYVRDFGGGWGRFSKMTDEEIAEAYEKAPRAERHKWKTHAFRRAVAIHDLIYEKQQADQNRDAIMRGIKEGTKDTVASVASNIPVVRDVAELGAYLTGFGSPRARYIRNRTKDLDEYLKDLSVDERTELLENWHLLAPKRNLTWDERNRREDLMLKHPTMPLYGFVEDTWQPVMTIFDIYGGAAAAKQLTKMGTAGAKKIAAMQAARRAGAARALPTAREVARHVGQGSIVAGSTALTAYDASLLKDDVKTFVTQSYAGEGNPYLEDYNLSQREFNQALQELRDLGMGDDDIKQFVRRAFRESK